MQHVVRMFIGECNPLIDSPLTGHSALPIEIANCVFLDHASQ